MSYGHHILLVKSEDCVLKKPLAATAWKNVYTHYTDIRTFPERPSKEHVCQHYYNTYNVFGRVEVAIVSLLEEGQHASDPPEDESR